MILRFFWLCEYEFIDRGREFFITLATLCALPFSIGLGILLMWYCSADYSSCGIGVNSRTVIS